jgi:tetratricopeptide (TPR) repeat protein
MRNHGFPCVSNNSLFLFRPTQGISKNTCESLKWKYKGNGHLEAGQLEYAIEAYDKALAVVVPGQEGIVLLMRATAYQQRASKHREKLKEILDDLMALVPDTDSLLELFQATANQPELANAVFRKLLLDTNLQESKFRQTQYRHGLYQYALLQAAQDSLRATQLLPTYPESWRKAGEILSDLWKLKESAMYFERAMELDASLSRSIQPVIERLQKRQELIGNVRAYGWSEDALRLALDVVR